jgi:hypothetical protein
MKSGEKMKWSLKFKVPIGFTWRVEKHINSLTIYVKKPEAKEWEEVVIEKELVNSWGGYGRECGGARYLVRVKPKDGLLPVAIGEYSYQACIPSAPSIKNYAVTEIRFVSICDIKIAFSNAEFVFLVRDTSEFIVNEDA